MNGEKTMRMSVAGPTSWKTTQHEPNQQFCLFSKDNSILVRLFGIFFITFSEKTTEYELAYLNTTSQAIFLL